MYEAYYGLSDKPFQTNPNPSFYFGSRQHQRAMAYLNYGLHRNEGFIVITGEVGAGKTTVVRNLFRMLDQEKIVSAHLVSTQLDAENALRLVCSAFGLMTGDVGKADLLLALERFLGDAYRAGKRCLLIVDEAQNLSMQAVEELRMLSNFHIESQALLQSFLVGQPEFRQTLQSPQMTQLRQRVIAACHIGPLHDNETRSYIEHRLTCAGWKGAYPFDADAFTEIHRASGGIPRRINAVCDRLLLSGFLSDRRTFTAADVQETARELEDETFAVKSRQPSIKADGQPGTPAAPLPPAQQVESLVRDDLLLRLEQIEQRMARIETALEGLLRNNSNALGLLARLVDEKEEGAPSAGAGTPNRHGVAPKKAK